MRRTNRRLSRTFSAFAGSLLGAVTTLAVGTAWLVACADDDTGVADVASDAALPDNRVEPLDGGYVDDAGGGPAPSCDTYCDLVEDACTDAFQQYATREECLGFCSVIPAGARADRTTNTVGCRAYHAGIPAKTEPAVHCASAGPFGNGVCGDRCTTFCQLAFALCNGTGDGAATPFPSVPDCVTACTGYPYVASPGDAGAGDAGAGDAGAGDAGAGDASADAGDGGSDTLNCRIELLRRVRTDGSLCAELGSPSNVCR